MLSTLVLSLPVAGPAFAGSGGVSAIVDVDKSGWAKHPPRHAHSHHHHAHRHQGGRHGYHRDPYRRGYYDRGHYGRGYYGESRDQLGQCWRERRRGHFEGEPAIISVRLCRRPHGQIDVIEGSERLIRYRRHRY